jgi:large subunit ribosomal protein L4
MELSLHTGGVVNISDVVFAAKFNEPLIHQVVTAYLAGSYAGTRAQKSRAQVKGTGSKPWRQKGTGRARAGTVKSPLWRGGGVTFAARPLDHSQKLNKKMYRGALRSILSELVRQERLLVVEQFTLDVPKTRALVAQLRDFNLSNVLIVIEQKNDSLDLAARNLHQVKVSEIVSLDPVSLLKFEKVLLTVAALKKIEERLQ